MPETLHELLPGITISKVDTPREEDVNSLLQGHSPEIFTNLVDNRTPFFFYLKFPYLEKLQVKEKNDDILVSLPEQALTAEEPSTKVKASSKEKKAATLQLVTPYRIEYNTGTARYTVKGSIGKGLDSLRVSMDIAPNPENNPVALKYRTKVDLYEDKQVQKLAREAAEKLGLRADLLELDLNRFTDLLEEHRDKEMATRGEDLDMNGVIVIPMTGHETPGSASHAVKTPADLSHRGNARPGWYRGRRKEPGIPVRDGHEPHHQRNPSRADTRFVRERENETFKGHIRQHATGEGSSVDQGQRQELLQLP